MALKQCRECKTEVSTEAKTCPKCGAPGPTAQTSNALPIIAGAASFGLFALCVSSLGGAESTQTTLTRREIMHGDLFGCMEKEMLRELDVLKAQSDDMAYRTTLSDRLRSNHCRKMRAGRMAEIKEVDEARKLFLVRQVIEGETAFYWVTSAIF